MQKAQLESAAVEVGLDGGRKRVTNAESRRSAVCMSN